MLRTEKIFYSTNYMKNTFIFTSIVKLKYNTHTHTHMTLIYLLLQKLKIEYIFYRSLTIMHLLFMH